MQAVILAGGKGTRLKPLTINVPKPMVLIHDKPFLHHQIELIASFGIHDILLLVSHLREKIEEYFGDGSKFGLNIEYSYEDSPMGTGGALKNAEKKIDNTFLLLNGDTFFKIDYGKLTAYFSQSGKAGVIAVYDNYEKIAPNNICVSESNLILDYNKNDSNGMTHVDGGVAVFNKTVLDHIPCNRVCSLEQEIYIRLIKESNLSAYTTRLRFYDMGTFKGMELIKTILK